MVTAESVKAKLQGLISLANATTGKTDTDLTAAVNALIAGFGQGGSSGGASGIYMAKITPASDVNRLQVVHNMGTTDILFAACFAETLGDITPTKNGTMARFYAKTDVPFRFGSTSSGDNYQVFSNYLAASGWVNGGGVTNASYSSYPEDEDAFSFPMSASNMMYIAGVTYTVIIMAASAFSVTEV